MRELCSDGKHLRSHHRGMERSEELRKDQAKEDTRDGTFENVK